MNTASTSTKTSKTTKSTQNRPRQRRKPSTVRTRKHHGAHGAAAHSDEALQVMPSSGEIGATNSPAFFLGPQRVSEELPVSRRNLATSTGTTLVAFRCNGLSCSQVRCGRFPGLVLLSSAPSSQLSALLFERERTGMIPCWTWMTRSHGNSILLLRTGKSASRIGCEHTT